MPHFVEGLEITDWRRFSLVGGVFVFEIGDQHSKLRAPVTQVIKLQHVVAQVLAQARNTVPDDSRPGDSDERALYSYIQSVYERIYRVTQSEYKKKQKQKLENYPHDYFCCQLLHCTHMTQCNSVVLDPIIL